MKTKTTQPNLSSLLADLRKFNAERDWEQFHSPKNLATALMVEAAELAEIFQWHTQAESRKPDKATRQRLGEEIGDVMIYLINLADKLGIDPLAAAAEKLSLNQQKYPVSLAKGNSLKYSKLGSSEKTKTW